MGFHISMFGRLRIVCELSGTTASRSEVRLTPNVEGLLAFLIIHRDRLHSRESLANLFWCNASEEHARRCLSTTLWRLRRALEPEAMCQGTDLVFISKGDVGFSLNSDHWLDVDVFEREARSALAAPADALREDGVQRLKCVLEIYARDLLENFYEDWALKERERLRTLYLNCLAHLMRYFQSRKMYDEALKYGEQILAADPLREEIHREMMHMYVACGQRRMAVQQYETCRASLARELGIAPMDETQALISQIIAAADSTVVVANNDIYRAAQDQFLRAARALKVANAELERALQLAQRLITP